MTDHSAFNTQDPALDPPPSAAEQRVLDVFAAHVGAPDEHTASWDTESRYAELSARLQTTASGPRQFTGSWPIVTGRASTAKRFGWFAGSLSVIFIVGVFLSTRYGSTVPLQPARTYVTAAGQRADIILRDGSHVTLAPRTSLVIDAGFGRTSRTVEVHGEAYFDVTNHNATPFIVRTGNTHTRVLGTRFDVRRYDGDAETRVVVVTGKVTVGRATVGTDSVRPPSVVLAERMVGQVTDSTATATTVSDIRSLTEWTDGRLTFHDTPVAEALQTLEHWYGYRFVLADSTLGQQHLSATFDYSRVNDVFSALKTLLDVTLSFDGGVVTVRPRGHTVVPAGVRRAVRDSMVHQQASEVGR